MIRNNKWKLIVSSAVILLPMVFGLIFWNKLPRQMTTHWGVDGTADGWSSRAFAVFAMPLFLLVLHLICILATAVDPKNKGQNQKIFGLVLWITPIISLFTNGVVYAAAFEKAVQPHVVVFALMGAMFVIIGNYLPKCKQNHTIGIKVKWTLENEENWNATHRFGGKVWVIGGLLLFACAFLSGVIAHWVMVCSIVMLVAAPIIYSWQYYKKQ